MWMISRFNIVIYLYMLCALSNIILLCAPTPPTPCSNQCAPPNHFMSILYLVSFCLVKMCKQRLVFAWFCICMWVLCIQHTMRVRMRRKSETHSFPKVLGLFKWRRNKKRIPWSYCINVMEKVTVICFILLPLYDTIVEPIQVYIYRINKWQNLSYSFHGISDLNWTEKKEKREKKTQ